MGGTQTQLTIETCAWRADRWLPGDLHLTPAGVYFFVFEPKPMPLWVIPVVFAGAFLLTFQVGFRWVWATVLGAFAVLGVCKAVSRRAQRRRWRDGQRTHALHLFVEESKRSWHIDPEDLSEAKVHIDPRQPSAVWIVLTRRDGVNFTLLRGEREGAEGLRDSVEAVMRSLGWPVTQ